METGSCLMVGRIEEGLAAWREGGALELGAGQRGRSRAVRHPGQRERADTAGGEVGLASGLRALASLEAHPDQAERRGIISGPRVFFSA